MRRILAVLLSMLIMAFVVSTQADVVTSTGEDGSTQLEGIAGDPVPCTYGSFERLLVKNMAKFDVQCKLTDAVYSNGSWVHVMVGDGFWLLAKATGPQEDALVTNIRVVGYPDAAGDVLFIASMSMAVTAKCGQIGLGIMYLLMGDNEPENFFSKEPYRYWYESGFDMILGSQGEYSYASIEYQLPLETQLTYETLGMEDASVAMVENAIPLADLISMMDAYGAFFGLSPIVFKEPVDIGYGVWISMAEWAGCFVSALSIEKGGPIGSVVVTGYSGDTNYAWAASMGAFMAVSGIPKEEILPYTFFSGERGTWDDLCLMKPYAVVNGVMLQCFVEEDTPVAYICAAVEAENKLLPVLP